MFKGTLFRCTVGNFECSLLSGLLVQKTSGFFQLEVLKAFQIAHFFLPANKSFLKIFQTPLNGWKKAGPPNIATFFRICKLGTSICGM